MAFLCWKSLTPATNDPCHCSTSVIPIVVVVHSRASPDARLSLPPLCHKNQKLSPCSLCAAVKSSNVAFHGSTQGILYGGGSLLLARGSRKQFIAACIRDSLMESGGSRFAIKPATPISIQSHLNMMQPASSGCMVGLALLPTPVQSWVNPSYIGCRFYRDTGSISVQSWRWLDGSVLINLSINAPLGVVLKREQPQ